VAVSVVALNTILKAILGPTLLLILGIGPFRVVDGAHWPSDVLAGYALGLARSITVLVVGLPGPPADRTNRRQPDGVSEASKASPKAQSPRRLLRVRGDRSTPPEGPQPPPLSALQQPPTAIV
jgi:hypothetical protein